MEPERSLPCSQEATTGLSPEPDESSLHLHSIPLKSMLILSSHLGISFLSGLYPLGFRTEILLCTPLLFPCPSYSPWLDRANNIGEEVRT
jgi:hypothetical protein